MNTKKLVMQTTRLIKLIFLSLLAALASPVLSQSKPNIVFILMDNLGYGEVGCYGGGITKGAATADWPAFLDTKAPEGAPNVLVILYDDTGSAACSAYGGRINMPTLNRLAKDGLTYTQWHTTAVCSPTQRLEFDAPKSGKHIVGVEFSKESVSKQLETLGQMKLYIDEKEVAKGAFRT